MQVGMTRHTWALCFPAGETQGTNRERMRFCAFTSQVVRQRSATLLYEVCHMMSHATAQHSASNPSLSRASTMASMPLSRLSAPCGLRELSQVCLRLQVVHSDHAACEPATMESSGRLRGALPQHGTNDYISSPITLFMPQA